MAVMEAQERNKEREMRREELYGLLGRLPDRDRPVTCRTMSREERGDTVLEKLELDCNGLEPVPAYFMYPRNRTGKVPAVLYNHSHGGFYHAGKEELLQGAPYLLSPPYGEVLVAEGYAVLCIDHWVFGERSGRQELDQFKEMLWNGQVMWGMMVYDSLRALDYLAARPEVDSGRIGTLGMSMGSTMAWWTAALDERVQVTVDICCMTDYQALLETNALHCHGIYYYVPDLISRFTTAEINGLIAPRPHLSLNGNLDISTPVSGLLRVDEELSGLYGEASVPERWTMHRYEVGHQETPEMRSVALAFLRKWL